MTSISRIFGEQFIDDEIALEQAWGSPWIFAQSRHSSSLFIELMKELIANILPFFLILHTHPIVKAKDYGHPITYFFQISQIFWPIGQIGLISCEVFQSVWGSTICSNFVTVDPQFVILPQRLFINYVVSKLTIFDRLKNFLEPAMFCHLAVLIQLCGQVRKKG